MTPALYRLVYFAPLPWTAERFAVGAIVLDRGRVRVAEVDALPGPDCVGGIATAHALRQLATLLRQTADFDELPASASPHAVLGSAQQVPAGVEDPVQWVARVALPPRSREPSQKARSSRKRKTEGWQFLTQLGVDSMVRKDFRPTEIWNIGSEQAIGLHTISHWVGHHRRVLLMEPLVPTRKGFEDEARYVNERFSSYRLWFDRTNVTEPRLVAYVLPGASAQQLQSVAAALSYSAHSVMNLSDESQRSEFRRDISRLAAEAEPSLH
jgi:hypothetical protein